ncbi:MAG: hypothetical protein EAX86_05765 [Candidatus Heimdallarchaeota archaeon]|nr:hypothetical protein [Candidatus Heimdallarchaeota archaeon]
MRQSINHLIIVSLLLFLYTNDLVISKTNSLPPSLINKDLKCEYVNIGLNTRLTEIKSTFSRYCIMNQKWNHLLLNLTVQNHGESIESVIISTEMNGATQRTVFATYQEIGLIKALNYQFDIPQSLIIKLNSSLISDSFLLNISIILEHSISWRQPDVDFTILQSEIIGLNSTQLKETFELSPLSISRHYLIHKVSFGLFGKPLLISTLVFIKPQNDISIDGIARIAVKGSNIDYIRIYNENHFVSNGNIANLSFSGGIPAEGVLELDVIVNPSYNIDQGEILITIEFSVFNRLLPTSHPLVILGNHPIPEWIMFPIMFIFLLGIPFYLVYQESLAAKGDKLIDQPEIIGD